MSETTKPGEKKTLTLTKKPEVKKVVEGDQVRQSFSHGRSKSVAVEVKKKRIPAPSENRKGKDSSRMMSPQGAQRLTEGEVENRLKVVQEAIKARAIEEERQRKLQEELAIRLEQEKQEQQSRLEEEQLQAENNVSQDTNSEEKKPEKAADDSFNSSKNKEKKFQKPAVSKGLSPSGVTEPVVYRYTDKPDAKVVTPTKIARNSQDEDEDELKKKSRVDVKRVPPSVQKKDEPPRRLNRSLITRAMSGEMEERSRSLASIRRAKQKHKVIQQQETVKVIRDVIIPEHITVSELANRMAVRGADVIKSLMKLGMMVTINQTIDADTAELICTEYGHNFKRVSETDIEIGLRGDTDAPENLIHRAPVVTIMGHVDHGKTSLLDALRQTDVVSGEAGGITQHIGAYQVSLENGKKITFIDTPGHAAFTEMRARGANVTDIVVLVVAADDGIMEQTIEAINHANAAKVPMIVAINKIDKPDANSDRVRSELLQYGVVLEEFGGDIMSVEVSAKQRIGLDLLEEAILLQSDVLDLKSNPDREAEGVVVEAKVDRGRGTVATVLIQRGTIKVGDILVAGMAWGRVRALISDHGQKIESARPSMPVEVLGLSGAPLAGDEFFVVESESRAREVAEFRQRRDHDAKVAASARGTMEQIMTRIASGEIKELSVVIKSDVQGSLEAISTSLAKLATDEVAVRVLHGGVGGINESDITLARASGGLIIGFNVRANPQAREMARREGVDIRYYSIIYDVIDDVKGLMGGLLAPTLREQFLGLAQIREVFNITKIGKVAGCYVTEGLVKRGAKVRLLRDDVVIHEGDLKTLRRFKDEVKEVKESYECGMAFENYNDIRQGDIIECFEIESIARGL